MKYWKWSSLSGWLERMICTAGACSQRHGQPAVVSAMQLCAETGAARRTSSTYGSATWCRLAYKACARTLTVAPPPPPQKKNKKRRKKNTTHPPTHTPFQRLSCSAHLVQVGVHQLIHNVDIVVVLAGRPHDIVHRNHVLVAAVVGPTSTGSQLREQACMRGSSAACCEAPKCTLCLRDTCPCSLQHCWW